MKHIRLTYDQVCLPKFDINSEDLKSDHPPISYFMLSSHARARSAIEFGLKMRRFNANIFVVGGDQRGRMSSTLAYLAEYIKHLPPAPDWVYLNNFQSTHQPIPYKLPPGKACRLKVVMDELLESVHAIFNKTFASSLYINQVNNLTAALEAEVHNEIDKLQEFAATKGLRIESGQDEFTIMTIETPDQSSENQKPFTQQDIQHIREQLGHITSSAHIRGRQLRKRIQELKKAEASLVLHPLMATLYEEFNEYLNEWIDDLRNDILDHIDDFLAEDHDADIHEGLIRRYAVNVFVENGGKEYPEAIVDPSPTYESLFGSIKYKSAPNGYITDFTMVRAGNLHKANGGILVLRSEAIVNDPSIWLALKVALRDRLVRIEERYRENTMPMLDAPAPHPIPLDIQIVLVGAPSWYYNFFFHDPEFRSYFKIKADIEPDLPATPENLGHYTRLICQNAEGAMEKEIDIGAIQYVLGYSARWSNNRNTLSSKFELIRDIIYEGSNFAHEDHSDVIYARHIQQAMEQRRHRNSVLEDRTHRDIEHNIVLIDTTGHRVGSVNGLTVLSMGDHDYGVPNRISARTFVGEEGVINIERLIDMGGPIQQKGAMILDGFLSHLFAQKHSVCCSCSITFEQNYSGVEGDSASLGELIAILSSLSGIPVRQDIAITGSLNQFGEVQAVGGISHKIEGFYRICNYRGLTGTQGVIIPASNLEQIMLRDEVSEAIREEKFLIWAVHTVEEAIELLMGKEAGQVDKQGDFPENTVYGAVSAKLRKFSRAIDIPKKH